MKVLVVGAGGIGSWSAVELATAGHDVVLASRSGSGAARGVAQPSAGIRTLQLDASDAGALAAAADGMDVIVNALNPPYTKWPELWPPVAAAFLAAAEASGAGLVTAGNLYPYGRVDGPMTEQTPARPNGIKGRVRDRMWTDALAAHREGRVRAVEIRASDYFGPGASAGTSYLNSWLIAPSAKGRVARPPMGTADAPHSWTYLPDIGAMVAAVAQSDQDGPDWGRLWHVPTTEARSMAQVTDDVAAACGLPRRGVKPWATWLRGALKLVVPVLRELDETAHQFERPFPLDSSAAQHRFGLAPTPWPDALASTLSVLVAQPDPAAARAHAVAPQMKPVSGSAGMVDDS